MSWRNPGILWLIISLLTYMLITGKRDNISLCSFTMSYRTISRKHYYNNGDYRAIRSMKKYVIIICLYCCTPSILHPTTDQLPSLFTMGVGRERHFFTYIKCLSQENIFTNVFHLVSSITIIVRAGYKYLG